MQLAPDTFSAWPVFNNYIIYGHVICCHRPSGIQVQCLWVSIHVCLFKHAWDVKVTFGVVNIQYLIDLLRYEYLELLYPIFHTILNRSCVYIEVMLCYSILPGRMTYMQTQRHIGHFISIYISKLLLYPYIAQHEQVYPHMWLSLSWCTTTAAFSTHIHWMSRMHHILERSSALFWSKL